MQNQQYSLDNVEQMSYEQVGAISDSMQLMATGSVSPMIVRYIVRTGQLTERFPETDIKNLLISLSFAATKIDLTCSVSQKIPSDDRDPDVDCYLDNLQPHTLAAIDVVTQKRTEGLSDSEIKQFFALHIMKELVEKGN